MASVQRPARPLIIGHRGAAGEAPENTLVSFRTALDQGADGLELDVHLSADGELIVCHDDTVDRTTDGSGVICRMTAAELMRLDAGRRFDERFAGERLPLLEQVFELASGDLLINVEVKCPYSPLLEKQLFRLLEQEGRFGQTVVSSFDHRLLIRLKSAEPRLRIGMLYDANTAFPHRKLAELSGVEVYSLHPYYKRIGAEEISDAIEHGFAVFPYTVNGEPELRRLLEAGVSGIITDFPGRLSKMLQGGSGGG